MTEAMTVYDVAQRGLVSSLLYLPGRIGDVIGLITADDFADGRCRTIWTAMTELFRANTKPTYAAVIENVNSGSKNQLVEAGGVEEIQRLYNEGASSAMMTTVATYAQIVKNEAEKRRLAVFADKLKDRSTRPGGNARRLIESARTRLDNDLIGLSNDSDTYDVGGKYDEYLDALRTKMDKYSKTHGDRLASNNGVPSGFQTIDEATGGFIGGQVITIGARTGIGKSFFLANAALAAAHAGTPVLYINMEMIPEELMDRFVSASSGVPLSSLRYGSLTDEQFHKVADARREFQNLPIEIITESGIGVDGVTARVQRKATSPEGIGVLMVDYLQLLHPENPADSPETQLAKNSRGMKLISMKFNIPVVQAVQLNRLRDKEEDPTPRIDDIRGSAAIGQDSSVVILIHRSKAKTDPGATPEDALFIIDKNRNGPDGIRFKCHTMLKYARFVEVNEHNDLDDGPAPSSGSGAVSPGESESSTPDANDSGVEDDSFASGHDVFDDDDEEGL